MEKAILQTITCVTRFYFAFPIINFTFWTSVHTSYTNLHYSFSIHYLKSRVLDSITVVILWIAFFLVSKKNKYIFEECLLN